MTGPLHALVVIFEPGHEHPIRITQPGSTDQLIDAEIVGVLRAAAMHHAREHGVNGLTPSATYSPTTRT